LTNLILDDIPYNNSFMTAFFDLTTGMANCSEFDEALVTSTIIDDIVRCVPTCRPKFYKTIERLFGVLDPLIQFMPEALDAFFSADGLGVFVKHISLLVEKIIASEKEEGDSLEGPLHIVYLSSLLKFILKLLKQYGSNDRLRNLIEGSLFKTIKTIFESQGLFGAEVFYSATHTLSTFIHTEPTSLSILQEGGVPQAFLRAVSVDPLPANAELLIILPQAFDAICLNSSGASAFIDADPLPNFLRFLSDPHYFRELQKNHLAVSKAMALGEAMNEFMRHHPNLCSLIIPNLVEAVDLLQSTFRSPFEASSSGSLSVERPPTEGLSAEIAQVSFEAMQTFEGKRRIDPVYVSMLESLCLFVESVVKTAAHREAFMAQRGVAKLLECYITPPLPADFTNSQACASINHCFHVLSESDPVPVMADITSRIKAIRSELLWFMEPRSGSAFLCALTKPTASARDWQRVSGAINGINVFGSLVALLADLCFAQHMNFSRTHARVVPAILDQADIAEMLLFIGHLMRCCLFEYWALRQVLPRDWLASACRFSQLSPFKSVRELEVIPVPAEIRVLSGVVDAKLVDYSDPEDVRIRNLKAALTVLRQVPTSVIAFFSGLARSLTCRRTVSTVLAELTPEQCTAGLEMLVRAVEFSGFVGERGEACCYLRNRLVSAGISLNNLLFIDESNFKMTLHLQALALFRTQGGFERLGEALEGVFMSLDPRSPFDMIAVNDVLESIYGLLARITDETLVRGNYWDDDSQPYNQLPGLFDFAAKWTMRVLTELPRLVNLLSIECVQLVLATCCNLLLTRNNIQVCSNLCTLLEEMRAGRDSFTVDKICFSTPVPLNNFVAFSDRVSEMLFESLVPLILAKSKDLTFDLAQLLARFSVREGFFVRLCQGLLVDSAPLQHIQIISIILNSPFKCQILETAKGGFEVDFIARVTAKIDSLAAVEKSIEDRNFVISAFSLVALQLVSMHLASQSASAQIPQIPRQVCLDISAQVSLYLRFENLSVDACHALLLVFCALSRDSSLLSFEPAMDMDIDTSSASSKITNNLLPIILKMSTRCLESEDVRHKSIVSLVALILRHLIETPQYLTSLIEQEMCIRFKAQNEFAFELDDLVAFAEPFLLRSIPCAKDALMQCFAIDVFSENFNSTNPNPDESQQFETLYSLKSTLKVMLARRRDKLVTSVERSDCSKHVSVAELPMESISVSSGNFMAVLKNHEASPLAAGLVDCIITQLQATDYCCWPQSDEDATALESDIAAQNGHFYRCALLLFLSELILAYPVCHLAFLEHKRSASVLEFIFRVMAPYGNVRFTNINQAYERSWVQYLLINLCMGSIVEEATLSVPGKKLSIDKLPETMAKSCDFVVTSLFAELKHQCDGVEHESEEQKELRIGRIFGLSDTIFCLLTIKASTVGRWALSMTAHIAALLIEKRAIHYLSLSLQFIDSNNPAYEEVTVNVVRTLEALCKYSNKLGKLAVKKMGPAGDGGTNASLGPQVIHHFSSSDESGFSSEDDFGFESGSSTDMIDGMESDSDSDDEDLDDSEIDSDDSDMDTDDDDDDEGSDSDMMSEMEIDIELTDDDSDDLLEMDSASGVDLSLSSVRGGSRNTRISNSGPYELIVEEIGEEDDEDEDGGGVGHGRRGFPVGMENSDEGDEDDDGRSDDEESVREYDYSRHDHHNHHHGFNESDDFDSDEHDHIDDEDDEDEDDEDELMMMGGTEMGLGDDDDWNEMGGTGGPGGGPLGINDNLIDFMEFPGGHLRARRGGTGRNGRHHGRNGDLNALLSGLNNSGGGGGIPVPSYSGQVRLGADFVTHPLMVRPVLDPLADPLRAHLPLTTPVTTPAQQPTSRPISIVYGRIVRPSSAEAEGSTRISRVNAEPFHFPQAVATSRRWQQDIRFTFSDLTRLICTALKDPIRDALAASSEPLQASLRLLTGEENRVMEIIAKADDSQVSDLKAALTDAISNVMKKGSGKADKDSVATASNDTNQSNQSNDTNGSNESGNDNNDNNDINNNQNTNTVSDTVEFVDEGLDVEFIQAVPSDLYPEIIQQHLVERRNRIPPGNVHVTVSESFLSRLPPAARTIFVRMSDEEIRAFSIFSSRTSRANSPASSNASAASRNLRNLINEVNMFLTTPASQMITDRQDHRTASTENVLQVPLTSLPLTSILTIPTVDPSSLVSILRSYYSPVISERRLHHKLFQSLVSNPRTRIELINLLIYVLERMPADMNSLGMVLDGYVESLTSLATVAPAPGKAIKRSRSGSNLTSGASSSSSLSLNPVTAGTALAPLRPQTPLVSDSKSKTHVPVLQRTLQLLLHLCSHNDDVCAFFTTPVEVPWTIKRHDRRAHKRASLMGGNGNGSGSGTASPSSAMTITTKFPLVLVMACLERGAFAESSLLIEYLLHLLDTVTAPLSKVVNPQDLKIEIPGFLLSSLVRTLVVCEFTPKAFQYASHVFQNLAVLSSASAVLLSDLGDAANRCVDELIGALRDLCDPAKVDMKKFSQSKAAPSRFLRLIRTTSSLCLQPSKEDRAQDRPIESISAQEKAKMSDKLRKLCRFEGVLEESIKYGEESTSSSNTSVSNTTATIASNPTSGSPVTIMNSMPHADPETLQYALVLLPVIEAFFLVHRLLQALGRMSENEPLEPSPVLVKFTEDHRGILNALIRTKPSLLTTGSLVTLTRLPRVLDFDNKRIFFRQQLHRKKPDHVSSGTLNITVNRAHVFEDSFRALQGKSGDEVKWGRLCIKFAEEEGVDAGGVAREWFSVLARQMFNPDYALFRTSAADCITYQPNRTSHINPDHLLYFHFVGRIIGKAVFDSRLLDCHFTRSFYKHILSIPVEPKDMEAVDPEMYKSLCWILENDITGVFDDLTFTTEAEEFGTVRSVELKENGASIAVTEASKREYVQLLIEFRLTTAIKPQIDAFLRGFHEIIPAPLISVFNEQELELLISGMPEIDLDDWRAHCDYQGGYTIASPQIQWFWRAVRSFDSETRAKLIQFVTGTSKVPLEGFAKLQGSDGIQKFQIHRDPRTKDRLPTAHTCFNQLDLPEYETYEELRQQLLLSINEGETGFGFI
jgi:hypothetical protein